MSKKPRDYTRLTRENEAIRNRRVNVIIGVLVLLAAISVSVVPVNADTSASGTITALIVSKSSNLRANLSDGNVILNWSGTAGGTYGIYITNDYLAGFPATANPNATNTTLLWTDTKASDYKQRYYRIGICAGINEDETGAKYEIPMKNGWNLSDFFSIFIFIKSNVF